jgi:hypothetical protein
LSKPSGHTRCNALIFSNIDFRETLTMILTLFSAALLSSASPVTMAVADADANKKICKREKQIGSLVRAKKICRTKAEWDEAQEQARQDVGEMQRTSRAPPNG